MRTEATMQRQTDALYQAMIVLSPSGDDEPRYRMEWRIQTLTPRAPGPAGIARLQFEPGGLEARFSHTQPHELLEVRVPYGEAEDAGEVRDLLRQGSFRPSDAALLDVLVGPDARSELQRSSEAVLDVASGVSRHSSFGRIAVMLEHLSRTARPVDGLWAAELTWLLQHAGLPAAFDGFLRATASAAIPALRLLDPTWLDRADDPHLRARLHQAIDACRQTATVDDVGPLATRLQSEAFDELRDALDQIAADAGVHLEAPPLPAFTGGPTEHQSVPGTETVTTIVDHTLQPYVTDVTARIVDGRLVVYVKPTSRLSTLSVLDRITIRVTVLSGDRPWLASTAESLRRTDDGLERHLTLPPNVRPQDLLVTVGRHLPQQPATHGSATLRNAHYYSGRVLDARRVGRSDQDVAVHAQRAWQALDQPGMVEELRAASTPPPFLAEILPGTGIIDLEETSGLTDPFALAAARSIMWGSWPAQAARLEAIRIEHGGDPDELDVRGLEVLALQAAMQGDLATARALDEIAVSRW